jgi:hypothetical protein
MSEVSNSDKEKKIRKHWLIATFVDFLGVPFVFSFVLLLLLRSQNKLISEFTSLEIAIVMSISFGVLVLWVLVLYYFAYKKHGNRFLMGTMIVNMAITSRQLINISSYSLMDLFMFSISLIIFIWWVKKSFDLMKINKEKQVEVLA